MADRDDVAFKKERDEKARANKEQQRDREIEEERKAAAEALKDMERAVQREQDAKDRLAEQLTRAELVFAREVATVKDSRRLGKRLAVHQFAKFLHLKTRLKLTTRSLNVAKKEAEIAGEEKEAALANQENDRDRRKNQLGESIAGQQHQLMEMLAEVETLKLELQGSKETLASKQELQSQVEQGHEKIRELLGEVERLNSVHSGEMATREMHIGRIEVQMQASNHSKDNAVSELRQARAEHVAYVAQATMRRDKLQAELDKNKSAKEALAAWQVDAQIRENDYIVKIAGLDEKLSNERLMDREMQTKLKLEVDRLEKALTKSQFVAQRQEQMRADDATKAKQDIADLNLEIAGNQVSLSQANNGLGQQKRLFSAMRDERDLMQNAARSIEQSLVAERRNVSSQKPPHLLATHGTLLRGCFWTQVVDAERKQTEAERHFQKSRKTIQELEDERDAALGAAFFLIVKFCIGCWSST